MPFHIAPKEDYAKSEEALLLAIAVVFRLLLPDEWGQNDDALFTLAHEPPEPMPGLKTSNECSGRPLMHVPRPGQTPICSHSGSAGRY